MGVVMVMTCCYHVDYLRTHVPESDTAKPLLHWVHVVSPGAVESKLQSAQLPGQPDQQGKNDETELTREYLA